MRPINQGNSFSGYGTMATLSGNGQRGGWVSLAWHTNFVTPGFLRQKQQATLYQNTRKGQVQATTSSALQPSEYCRTGQQSQHQAARLLTPVRNSGQL